MYNRENILSYIVGNYRMKIYYSKFWGFLMRRRIREQICIRINSMDYKCYAEGACVKCGCATPALQMADKTCNGFCYPPMLSKRAWYFIYDKELLWKDPDTDIIWYIDSKNEFKKLR